MPTIHPSAIVSRDAEIAEDAEVGAWCVLDGPVRLGPGARLVAGVHVHGPATIGARTIAYPGVCVGFPAQDVKFKLGDPTAGVVVGEDCRLREHVTIHAATSHHTPTRVGDRVFMMVGAHVGHDGRVGDDAVMVNATAVGGHASIGERATIGGGTMVHQFCRIGRLAFLAGGVGAPNDVPPFCTLGDRNQLAGINVIGLRRAGFERADIDALRGAFHAALRDPRPIQEVIGVLRELGASSPPVMEIADFVADSERRRPITPGVGKPPRFVTEALRKLREGETIPGLDTDTEDEA